jgi:hypothetical protein
VNQSNESFSAFVFVFLVWGWMGAIEQIGGQLRLFKKMREINLHNNVETPQHNNQS